MNVIEEIRKARRVSTPLVMVKTPDHRDTTKSICEGINGDSPKIEWDCVTGCRPCNETGGMALAELNSDEPSDPISMLVAAARLREGTILMVHNAQFFLNDPAFIQAVYNLRDEFKQDRRMLILLSQTGDLPLELNGHVLALEQPRPGREELERIVRDVHVAAAMEPCEDSMPQAVSATTGLIAYEAEQLTAMSLTPDGIVLNDLRQSKYRQIEQTKGITVYPGTETFSDIGGVEYAKQRSYRIATGYGAQAVVQLEELEKQMSGAKSLDGTTGENLERTLTYMEQMKIRGLMFCGVPGCSKSLLSGCLGNELGVPTIQFNMNDTKASLVGQSGDNFKRALDVITSVSNGKPLFIATLNSIAGLDTAFLRRFQRRFFFDLPDAAEREMIWPIHMERLGLPTQELPPDDLWVGSDIRNCCESAAEEGVSLLEAARGIIPVGVTSAADIEVYRQQANGRFLSASYEGAYRIPMGGAKPSQGRQMDM